LFGREKEKFRQKATGENRSLGKGYLRAVAEDQVWRVGPSGVETTAIDEGGNERKGVQKHFKRGWRASGGESTLIPGD